MDRDALPPDPEQALGNGYLLRLSGDSKALSRGSHSEGIWNVVASIRAGGERSFSFTVTDGGSSIEWCACAREYWQQQAGSFRSRGASARCGNEPARSRSPRAGGAATGIDHKPA